MIDLTLLHLFLKVKLRQPMQMFVSFIIAIKRAQEYGSCPQNLCEGKGEEGGGCTKDPLIDLMIGTLTGYVY